MRNFASMRLLHLITALHTGGAERMLAELSHQWAGTHQLHVAYLKPIHTLSEAFHPDTHLHPIGLDTGTVGRLRKLLQEIKPDVIHTHLLHADFLGLWAARGFKGQKWITLHNAHFRTGRTDFFFQLGYALLLGVVARDVRAVAISKSVEKHGKKWWGLAKRTHLVLNPLVRPLPMLTREEARAQLGLNAKEPVLVFLGRLEPQKGLTYLLLALARLAAFGTSPRIYIVGEGKLESELKRQAASFGLLATGNTLFVGYTKEPGLYLAAADALVLPSLFEGLGNVVAEAFSFGVPVVASDIEGPAEIIEHETTGLLVPPANGEMLAAAIRKILGDKKLRAQMSAKALEKAKAWPTREEYARQLTALYKAGAVTG